MTMPHQITTLALPSPEATATLARALGAQLRPGDVLLLSGGIGAGKTHFARAMIQSMQDRPEDVPSPTFTLVQEYDTTRGPLWHSDLYRLSHPDEVFELGLVDAFTDAICVVEWPDRLDNLAPASALRLSFATTATENLRELTISWTDIGWDARLSAVLAVTPTLPLSQEVNDFLMRIGWDGTDAQAMTGDASSRMYMRLHRDGRSAVLMIDPNGDTALFARLARYLTGIGLSAPHVLAEAPGLLLLEDMGDALIARLSVTPEAEKRLYLTATDALIRLHDQTPPPGLPEAVPDYLAQAIDLAFTFYAPMPDLMADAIDTFRPILAAHAAPEDVMILRDYHAENILLMEGRTGAARAGLLDFQDALVGHTAYDLVSLCRDVRRDVLPATEEACIQAYLNATGSDPDAFRAAYAVLGVQRNLRILGVFARLAVTQGKTRYLDFLPRTWAHIQTQLAHPALAPMRPILAQMPVPDRPFIQDLLDRCPR